MYIGYELYDWKENIAKFSDIQTKQQSVLLVLKYTTLQHSKTKSVVHAIARSVFCSHQFHCFVPSTSGFES